jgi:hypothetical protein
MGLLLSQKDRRKEPCSITTHILAESQKMGLLLPKKVGKKNFAKHLP